MSSSRSNYVRAESSTAANARGSSVPRDMSRTSTEANYYDERDPDDTSSDGAFPGGPDSAPASQPMSPQQSTQQTQYGPEIPIITDYTFHQLDDPDVPWREHKALIATKDIPEHTRIALEKPLITLRVCHIRRKTSEQIANFLVQQYNMLSPEDREWIDRLRPAACGLLDDLKLLADGITHRVKELEHKTDRECAFVPFCLD